MAGKSLKYGKSFAVLFWLLSLDFIVNHLEKIRARNEGNFNFRVLKEVGWLMDWQGHWHYVSTAVEQQCNFYQYVFFQRLANRTHIYVLIYLFLLRLKHWKSKSACLIFWTDDTFQDFNTLRNILLSDPYFQVMVYRYWENGLLTKKIEDR